MMISGKVQETVSEEIKIRRPTVYDPEIALYLCIYLATLRGSVFCSRRHPERGLHQWLSCICGFRSTHPQEFTETAFSETARHGRHVPKFGSQKAA